MLGKVTAWMMLVGNILFIKIFIDHYIAILYFCKEKCRHTAVYVAADKWPW